jgi:hypothetical protein
MKTSLVDRRSVERLLLLVGALRSGLVDALRDQEPRSAEQAAGLAGTDPRASRIVLEALSAEGIVERTMGVEGAPLYRLSPLGRAHLVDEGPELERSGLLHQANKLRGWLELPQVIRTGKPAPRDAARLDVRSLVCAMGERDQAVLDEIVEKCFAYAGTIRTMLDVGGAVGHLARQFARRGVRATLFDREDVLPVAREFLGAEASRIAFVGGDYTVSLPPGSFDLVYFGNVYHIYGAETNARVTRKAFGITAQGGTVAIQDYTWDRSEGAAMFAVNMLRSTADGEVWPAAEYRGWLNEAGFVDIETLDLETAGTQLMLARRPVGL